MKQIKIKTSILLACGLAFIALPRALAESNNDHATDAMFKAADTNNDGKVARAEHAAYSKKMFTDADTNRDGTVTLAEMTAAQTKMKGSMTTQTDLTPQANSPMKADRADKATKAGNHARDQMSPAAMIAMHDTNNDSQLSAAEHAAGCAAMFTQLDTNNDGMLTKEECQEGKSKMKSAY
jgi:Ca2+-binding EF-hand superfamily protein